MSNKNAATVNNTTATANAQTEPKLSAYATNAMRPVIIQKSLDGVRRAITPKMCEDCGVTEERLGEWKYNVSKLYDAAVEYSRSLGTAEEAERENEVWEVWRTIIKVGEEDIFHPNMFVRRKDVENLRVLAAESDELYVRGIGFVPTVKGQEAFRSKVEIRLALRIAGNKTLNDRQREVLKDYNRAERLADGAEKLLNGYTQGKTVVASITAQITDAEAELAELTQVLTKAGASNIEKLTARQRNVVKTLKEQKKAAETRLKNAQKTMRDLQESYDAIIGTLDSIEGCVSREDIPKSTETKEERRERILDELANVTK